MASNIIIHLGSDAKVDIQAAPTFRLEIECHGKSYLLKRNNEGKYYHLKCYMRHYVNGITTPLYSLSFGVSFKYKNKILELNMEHFVSRNRLYEFIRS